MDRPAPPHAYGPPCFGILDKIFENENRFEEFENPDFWDFGKICHPEKVRTLRRGGGSGTADLTLVPS